MPQSDRPKNSLPAQTPFFLFAGGILFTVILVLGEILEKGNNFWLKMSGLIFLGLALPFMFLPFFQLKRHGSVAREESYMSTRKVADKGLYSLVRHPQYLGYILMISGFTLVEQNRWISLVGTLAVISLHLHIRSEDRFCRTKFGEAYLAYCHRVPMMNLPLGLWRRLRKIS